MGYPRSQLEEIFDAQQLARLDSWLYGQTMGLCDGTEWDHDAQEHVQVCPEAHGSVIYRHDIVRFLRAGPITD